MLVLIDGDGMIFNDHLIGYGEAGGKEAAGQMWTQAYSLARERVPNIPMHFKIVTRVYANLRGLADICERAGIVDRAATVEEFARGFTGAKSLFDFVDVGSGKDRADEKITGQFAPSHPRTQADLLVEMLKLHLSNLNCQHVIFGGSHDNGYARLLEDVADKDRNKITLLEGVPFERELRTFLSVYGKAKFSDLFRPTKINVYSHPISSSTMSNTAHAIMPPPGIPISANGGFSNGDYEYINGTPMRSDSQVSTNTQADSNVITASRSDLAPSAQSRNTPSPAPTWAGMVTAVRTSPQNSHISITPQPETPTIPRNKYGHRIDPMITRVDNAEMKRVGKIKMCNVHYLRQDCPFGDDCTHDHSYKPTKAEMELLRQINRGTPCRNGTGCNELKCMYGHRCPLSVEGSKICKFGSNCRFGREMHGVDLTVVRTTKV